MRTQVKTTKSAGNASDQFVIGSSFASDWYVEKAGRVFWTNHRAK